MSKTNLTAGEQLLVVLLVLPILAGAIALSAWLTAWAWNVFMPSVFGLPQIGFWQAFALTVLITSLKGLFSSGKKS